MQRLSFEGDLSQTGFGHGYALSVRGLKGFRLEQSRITGFLRGVIIDTSRDVIVRNNELSGMSSDGLDFVQVENVLIEGNYLHDFFRPPTSKAHPDMIQFWTNGTRRPSKNITIRRNILSSGKGMWTQSIFMRNEMVDARGAGLEMFYRNISITENLIINAHLHGITVGETMGLTIANNTLIRNPGSAGKKKKYQLWTPQISIKHRSRDVRITANVAEAVHGFREQEDWQLRDNLMVQNRSRLKPGHYSQVLDTFDPQDPTTTRPRPGGPLDGTGIGAPAFRSSP